MPAAPATPGPTATAASGGSHESPAALVAALHAAFGEHHARAVHAKGIVLEGVFAPTCQARELSSVSLFAGGSVPVTVRFSDFTGIPDIPDTADGANPRGLGVKFRLPDGAAMDVVAHGFNGFPVTDRRARKRHVTEGRRTLGRRRQSMLSSIARRLMWSETSAARPRFLAGSRRLTIFAIVTACLSVTGGPVRSAPSETLVPLQQQAIPNLPGKTLTAVNVVFPPGAKSVPHRHGDAFLYAYVLEGAIRSQIEGGPARVYKTGESWTEKSGDHHVLTENVSSTETARLLVVFVASTGASLKMDDKEP